MINPGTLPCPWYIYMGATFNPDVIWADDAANFIASMDDAGVLTVTSISNGLLAIGQLLFVPNIPIGVKITSLGTGAGGVGTYNTDYSGSPLNSQNMVVAVPVDLTGFDAIIQIRPYTASDIIIATLSVENGGIIVADPTSGIMQLLLTPEQTAALSPQEAVFDLQMTAPLGVEIDYLLQGEIIIQQMRTR